MVIFIHFAGEPEHEWPEDAQVPRVGDWLKRVILGQPDKFARVRAIVWTEHNERVDVYCNTWQEIDGGI